MTIYVTVFSLTQDFSLLCVYSIGQPAQKSNLYTDSWLRY